MESLYFYFLPTKYSSFLEDLLGHLLRWLERGVMLAGYLLLLIVDGPIALSELDFLFGLVFFGV